MAETKNKSETKEEDSEPISARRQLAIVGGGPRGLSALEQLYQALAQMEFSTPVYTILFEATQNPGCGPIYNTKQIKTNWLNVPERTLSLKERPEIRIGKLKISSFPAYQQWPGRSSKQAKNSDPDIFPTRAQLGQYLSERFQSIAGSLRKAGLLRIIHARIDQVKWNNNYFEVVQADGSLHQADEVVLAIGHQPTELSDQLLRWLKHSGNKNGTHLFFEPYPVERLLNPKVINSNSTVALRGFGLSMIDIIRALTEGLDGHFQIQDEATLAMKYVAGKATPKRIVTFSLNGLPMAPKPLNGLIDDWFKPNSGQMEGFRQNLVKVAQGEVEVSDNRFLIEAIAEVAAQIFLSLDSYAYTHNLATADLTEIITTWLEDSAFSHSLIIPHDQSPVRSMQDFVNMATDRGQVSLDYCVGQVWRHCQPTIYEQLSFSVLSDEVISDVISLDERMKRYSFGPPVASIQQLLALVSAGVMTLNVVDDPDIKLVEKGWQFEENVQTVVADVMVNTVLDAPKLLEVTSAIVRNLLQDSIIEPIHDELGVHTSSNGCVQSSNKEAFIPLAILGRLSKGSIIGVDALDECFGPRIHQWATSFVERKFQA